MKKYAVELGDELGKGLGKIAVARGLNLTGLVRHVMWNYLDAAVEESKTKKKKFPILS